MASQTANLGKDSNNFESIKYTQYRATRRNLTVACYNPFIIIHSSCEIRDKTNTRIHAYYIGSATNNQQGESGKIELRSLQYFKGCYLQ